MAAPTHHLIEDQGGIGDRIHELEVLQGTIEVLETVHTRLISIFWDNASAGADSFLKFYNSASATLGTTVPDMVIPIDGTSSGSMYCTQDSTTPGIKDIFTTAMAVACVTTAGTGGTTDPTSNNDIYITTRKV